jgi:hypothetical protein
MSHSNIDLPNGSDAILAACQDYAASDMAISLEEEILTLMTVEHLDDYTFNALLWGFSRENV